MRNLTGIIVSLVVALVVLILSVYTVDQREAAMVFRLGEIVRINKEPGLYLKMPFVENVRYFDTRVLTLDAVDPERFITSEKKNVLVDYFVKWRVFDVEKFYVSFSGDERRAANRLAQTVNDGMRAEFGQRTVHDVVSGERDDVMDSLRKKADADARRYGVQVLDVRIKRVDLPTEVSESVYRRMDAERKRVANELRSTGSAEAEKIRADADKQREIIVAEAYRDAQRIKGEGDGKASAIYGAAYGQNPEFYAFYRSMESYRNSFRNKTDLMVVQPNSEFFRYMKSSKGGGK
ncbi:MAG TPA: protease modulator HflC [Thiobacillaceae bacterium]|nr:protease modulator HflC [Thiobacillaceae bacterium]HNH89964.1 protease modulator HflC [Thiobacillaceae bacterium]